jgi:hypothetical protein
MRRLLISGLVGLQFIAAPVVAQEVEMSTEISSVYTDLNIDDACIAYQLDMLGGSFACAGYKGYSVLFQEGDARESVFYGFVGDWFGEGAFESFQAFNNVGDKIEWRLVGEIPFAAILRWHISAEDGTVDGAKGQVLVVSKVAQPAVGDGCVVGYVDALENDNANEMAREVADNIAREFRCRIDEPEFHGNEGLAAGFPMRTFGP